MQTLQGIIHKFEVGEGRHYIPVGAGILLFIAILAIYNLREATGFASIEAMDTSQIARNIAQGEGFTTNFIRPLSLALVEEQGGNTINDPLKLQTNHPDLANPPLYPYLLGGIMKALPFTYRIPELRSKNFWRFQPEIIIGVINQGFFIASGILLFLIARRLFDDSIAYFTVIVFFGTDLMWRFAFSGLSTNLAMFLTLVLTACLVKLERGHPCTDFAEKDNPLRIERPSTYYILMGAFSGLMLGALMLTRYSLGWLLFPTSLFFCFYLPGKRLVTVGSALVVTALVVSPWLIRNHQLSGKFFGTAGYAHYHETSRFQDTDLERNLQGDIGTIPLRETIRKYFRNTGDIVENQIANLGGSWLSALFLAGLLIPFSNKSLNRLRIFTIMGLLTLATVQAIGRTYLSDHSPQINSENLLIFFLPLVYLFGAGLFYLLLDQLNLNFAGSQFYVSLLVALLACLPLIFRILPPRTSPVAYPPYSPPLIQRVGNWFEDDELMMSDMPWAVGWYADKKCLWLTKNLDPDFFTINDRYKPINGLYLTPITTDGRFVTDMVRNSNWAWGRLHMDVTLRKNLPKGFPLLHVDDGFMPDQLVLTDWPRWNSDGN